MSLLPRARDWRNVCDGQPSHGIHSTTLNGLELTDVERRTMEEGFGSITRISYPSRGISIILSTLVLSGLQVFDKRPRTLHQARLRC